jgi:hypothetical protein
MRLTLSLLIALNVAARSLAASPTDLQVGQFIKVEGHPGEDGVFVVEQVTLRDQSGFVKIEGRIESVSGDRARVRLLGFDVTVDSATRVYRGSQATNSRAMLVAGAWVEAKGVWRKGTLKATRIRYKDAPEATEEIEGSIEAADPNTFTLLVLNRRLLVPPHAPIADERTGNAILPSIDRLRRDDDDGEGRKPLEVGNVVLGGRVEAGFLGKSNFEMGAKDADHTMLTRAQVLGSSELSDTVEAYAKVTLARNLAIAGASASDARVSEAYLLFHRVASSPIDLQVGRQRFRDGREWFFDEYLDAARLFVTLSEWKLEAAVARGLFSGPIDLRPREDQIHVIASASRTFGHVTVAAYGIGRRDAARNEAPLWIGATVSGAVGPQWTYWTTTAVRRGSERDVPLGGWAFDSGVTRRFAVQLSPAVTVGYASGSGDEHSADGRDTRFRQTDLEDNRAYFGGVRRLAAYGELFDPELSNLRVFSAGASVGPRRDLTLDLVYHRYSQAVASRSLPSGNLEGTLTGVSRALGQELNAAVTLRALPGLDVDFVSGVFMPGSAFVERGRPAFFWRPQLRFYF